MNKPEDTQRLFDLDNLLDGAGSDSAQITMSNYDAELLGIADSEDEVTETFLHPPTADDKGKLLPSKTGERKSPAVIPHEAPAQGFTVNVGFARRALAKKLKGRQAEKRQPDVPIPQVEEPISAEVDK